MHNHNRQLFPLSAAQRGMWFSQAINLNAHAKVYKITEYIDIRGEVRSELLEMALRQTIQEAESFHLVFEDTSSGPAQYVNHQTRLIFPVMDFRQEQDPVLCAEQWMQTEMARPFDLYHGPLFSFALLQLEAELFWLYASAHHLVMDGFGGFIFVRRVAEIYSALVAGTTLPLRPFTPLSAVLEKEAQYQESGRFLKSHAYWQQQSEHWPEPFSLVEEKRICTDIIRCQGHLTRQVHHDLLRRVDDLNTTIPQLLTTITAAYLSRISEQDDMLLGFPVMARNTQLLRDYSGMMTNVMPLHLDFNTDVTLTEALSQVHREVFRAVKHQCYRPPESGSATALTNGNKWQFSTIINVIPFPYDLPFGDSLSSVNNLLFGPTDDLIIHFCDYGPERGFEIFLDANAALYSESQLKMHLDRLIHFFTTVLQGVPETPLSQFSVLLPEEHDFIRRWNQTDVSYPQDRDIYGLFKDQVLKTPAATAVIHQDRRFTYGELDQMVCQLAGYLQANGVIKGQPVGICLDRSFDLILSELAILKCGGVYVPVDPDAPGERLNYVLSDCQARILLVREKHQPELDTAVQILTLPLSFRVPESGYLFNEVKCHADDPAYIMYTSGSTGNPKGVAVPHRAIVRLVVNCGYADFNAQDRVAFAANPAFDASTMEVWAPLLNGGTSVVIDQHVLLNPVRFSETLIKHQVSVLWMTAGLFKQYTDYLGMAFKGLRYLIVGGDVIDPSLIRHVLENNPPAHLLNGYGPTETTTFALTHEIAPTATLSHSIPLGRPISNTRVYILDSQRHPVPIGVTGEIYIGGDGVALGYVNRPDLTEERFLLDPFSDHPEARMYKSGDLGRWSSDGVIEFCGRNDDQVKIRGYRIEPAEIALALQDCEGVRHAVVIVEKRADQEKRLIAYYIPQPDFHVMAEKLRAELETVLPDYMIPAAYVALETLPLTANGKVNYKALPIPDEDAYVKEHYEAPCGETEQKLAFIWQQILNIKKVGRNDHFFALGGHSLLAVQLISRIREQLKAELNFADIFEWPVLRQLATKVDKTKPSFADEMSAIQSRVRQKDGQLSSFPLSFAQQRLWFLAQMDPAASQAYIIAGTVRLQGACDIPALQKALDCIVARHAALRTYFQQESGQPVQKINTEEQAFPLQVIDVPDRITDVEPFNPVFDLACGPLVQGRLLCLPAQAYQLQLAMHHIIADGWSVSIFLRELNTLYSHFCQGRQNPLPELSHQYIDYACWQHESVQKAAFHKQQAYWAEQLQGIPECLNLPVDRPRPVTQDYTGHCVPVTIDREFMTALKAFSMEQECTLYMVLLASWAVVMGRLANQNDVVIGSPVSGRTRTETESLIGMFVNSLALRIDLSDDPDTETLLMRVKSTALAAQANQDVPFEQIVEAISPARSLSHSPVFQVMFALQNVPPAQIDLPGLTLQEFEPLINRAKFDLSLELTETSDSLEGYINYASALFDRHTVERYLSYWLRVLKGMIAHSRQSVYALPLLSESESLHLCHHFSQGQASAVPDHCVHEWFEQQAIKTPEAVAVMSEQQKMTYQQLNQHANQLARYLKNRGVGPEVSVAICCERTPGFITAMLAVLKAGGGYIPLDPAYPAERLEYILSDSHPALLLTDEKTQSLFPESQGREIPVICLERESPLWTGLPSTNMHSEVAATHLAYVIYTSGSTGRPKGVMVEHANLMNLIGWHHQAFQLEAGQFVSSIAGLGFDAFVWEIWPALCAGTTLRLLPQSASGDPEQLLAWWCAQPLHVSFLSTPIAELVLARGLRHPTLKTLLVGGDQLHALPAPESPFTLVNNYGPTETTVVATSGTITARSGVLHIGRPIMNMNVYILDQKMQCVPVGVAGEIYIGGAGVSRGYLNQPELTEKHFLSDPFSDKSGARMYRTGDLGRWLADGTIEYLGRNDHQIQIRGYRIELGEITSAIQHYEGIQNAVVVALANGQRDKRLVAYYTESLHQPVSVDELKKYLNEHLPQYMVPVAYMRLECMPLTNHGKIDYKSLPQPDDRAFAHQQYEQPQGKEEEVLAEVWGALLGLEKISRHDHFFELGGHSLLAVQVIESLRRKGYHLSVKSLFNQPVLKALAENLTPLSVSEDCSVPPNYIAESCIHITPDLLPLIDLTQEQIDAVVATVPGGAANVKDIYPLAPLQEGILFHHLLAQDSDPYINTGIFAFSTLAEVNAFTEALQQVINRHDILRTAIVRDGLPEAVQVVWREAVLPIETLTTEADDVTAYLQQRFDPTQTQLRMDITQAPMAQVSQVADPANQRWLLCLQMHHLCNDHTTTELILEEVQAFLNGQAQQLPAPLPFRNFVALTRSERSRAAQQVWFREQLGDIDEPCTPFGLIDVRGSGCRVRALNLSLEHDLAMRLRRVARSMGISAASLFHLGWGLVVRAATGRDDVVFGTVLFGRMDAGDGADRILGMFLNTLPLRLSLPDLSVREAVIKTHATLAELLNYEHTSLIQAQRCSGVPAETPLFSSLMNYRYLGGSGQAGVNPLTMNVLSAEERTNYPLTVSVNDYLEGDFSLDMQVDESIRCERVGTMMLEAMAQLATALEQHPDKPVLRLPVLSPEERHQVLEVFNTTARAFPETACIHQLIEQQAERQPQAVAVKSDGQQLSYAALNARANQLAHWLVGQGVRPDSRVAVALERSCELMVCLLAVLKAGGAYVPLDPDYPQERLTWMLADSAPVVLLTSGEILPRLGEIPDRVKQVRVRDDQASWASCSEENLSPASLHLTSRNLAYVIYTSGSTGQPKGVMNEHRGVINRLCWMIEDYDFHADDIVLQKTPVSFDVSVWELFCPFLAGATQVMARPGGHKDPAYLQQLIEAEQITRVHFVPPMLQSFLEALPEGGCPTLRSIFCSGEALPAAVIRKAYNRLPDVTLYNLYGPTEAAVEVTAWRCPREMDSDRVLIGAPVANTRMYILDAQGEPLPAGVAGELYIGGVQVARGYLNRPELTGERFVSDPFSPAQDARMYKTGDMGCWHADGTIEYLGRNDDQVKIRGFRIELGEVTSAVQECRGVSEAIVIARGIGVKQLVAYYTTETGEPLSARELKAELGVTLPEFMVPAAYVRLGSLPLMPNGKVNRKRLPEPDENAFIHEVYEAPQGKTEQLIATIWQTLLGIQQVGRRDNFFALGGHSLLAIQFIDRLRQHQYVLPVKVLFEQPVLADLAGTLTKNTTVVATAPVPENKIPSVCYRISPEMLPLVDLTQEQIDAVVATVSGGAANIKDIYPLVPLQEGILFHHLLAQDSDPYINTGIFAFSTLAEVNAFTEALQQVINRHDILRTAIVWDGLPEAVQVVWREAVLPIEILTTEADDVTAYLQQQLDPTQTQLRMDITHAPMVKATQVADPANQRWLLCLQMHHLCNDHTTTELILEEVQAFLSGQAQQLPAPLPFRNFVALTRTEQNLSAQEAWFREQLGDIDEPCTPFGMADVQGNGCRVYSMNLPLTPALSEQLRRLSRSMGISAASLFHLGWGLVVRAATGRDDVVFGTVLFGRMDAGDGADRILGMFLNTLPLRLSLPDLSVREAVFKTHATLAELLNYEHTSLIQAQRCSGVPAGTPLFSSLFNYRYLGGSGQAGVNPLTMDVISAEERTNYPLAISVNDYLEGDFSLDILADAGIGCERVGTMMLEAMAQLVTALEQHPDKPVLRLPVLSPQERHQVLEVFNTTARAFPETACIHQLIEQQAEKQPQAVAVKSDGQQLSYAVLNARANQLAHWLVGQGVRPDSRVAVALERSCELMVCLLAVLKAGGAYVPLDPDYPQERLTWMLADSAPVVLLTSGEILPRLGEIPDRVKQVRVRDDQASWASCSEENLSPASLHLTSRNLAYVIYTSGSTGQPKGVMNEHRGVINRLCWMIEDYDFHADDIVLQKTPVSFDASVWELFCPFLAGATQVMARPGGHKDPAYLQQLIEAEQITRVHFVPPMLQSFLEALPEGGCPTLRSIFCSGEALPAAVIRKAYNRLPDVTLYNLYGPTEAAVEVTAWRCPREMDSDRVLIGAPVANTRMYILDAQGEPLPAGVAGELYIGGVQVARGYLNRPELTGERFVSDPFSPAQDARMYKTGDMGCWHADGTIEYLGRNDDQVKIRGFRIELGEVTSAVQECRGVSEAIVIARGTGVKQLVAYYTTETGEPLSARELKAELGVTLPEFMVPAAYVRLGSLPLMPNGKVNRKRLPEPDENAFIHEVYEAPQGKTEQLIATIWQTLLGIQQVGRRDNFFALGGHSLLSIRMVNQLRHHGIQLSLPALFSTSRLYELAALIDAEPGENASSLRVLPFRSQGSQRPLFIVPEASGELLYGPVLTSGIDAEIPVYGLVAPDRHLPPHHTYQKVAQHYVRSIRSVQPQGPYRLIGWSLGGTLAYEVAAQLLGQDQAIEFLGMLDSWAWRPDVVESTDGSDQAIAQACQDMLITEAKIRLKSHEAILEIGKKLTEQPTWTTCLSVAQSLNLVPDGWSENYFLRWVQHRYALFHAKYQVPVLPVNIDLFVAQEAQYADQPYRNWDKVLPESAIHLTQLNGGHSEIITEPYVADAGRAISEAIRSKSHRLPCSVPEDNPVIQLQEGTKDGEILVCVPGAGDNVFAFMDLVQLKDDVWTVLGIQPRGLLNDSVPHSTVEAAAAYYQKALEVHLRHRPVHLLGHSYGGWVVLELAARLEAMGIAVISVTIAGTDVPQEEAEEYTDLQVMLSLITLFEMKGETLCLSAQQLSGVDHRGRLKLLQKQLIATGIVPVSTQLKTIEGIYRVFAASIRTGYKPARLPQAPVLLVAANDASPEQLAGWQALLPELSYVTSEGNHLTLLKSPHVGVLASTAD